MDNKKKLIELINHYGIMEQLKYIHTEYFELDEAIINSQSSIPHSFIQLNASIDSEVKHIAEEIADIMVMLKQFQYYYGITDEYITEIMNFKIDRQLERIKYENSK